MSGTSVSKKQSLQASFYFLGDEITFDSIDVTLSVEDIYYQIESEEIVTYLEEKNVQEKDLEEK